MFQLTEWNQFWWNLLERPDALRDGVGLGVSALNCFSDPLLSQLLANTYRCAPLSALQLASEYLD
jgi:hypothetical protein